MNTTADITTAVQKAKVVSAENPVSGANKKVVLMMVDVVESKAMVVEAMATVKVEVTETMNVEVVVGLTMKETGSVVEVQVASEVTTADKVATWAKTSLTELEAKSDMDNILVPEVVLA